MQRLLRTMMGWGPVFATIAAAGAHLPGAQAANDGEITVRDLARRYTQSASAVELKNATGLDVQHVVALEHTLLLIRNGQEQPVLDPENRRFGLGDQIRVRIRPVTAAYLYVFAEGASGERKCLLPEKEEKPLLVQAGETVTLPPDAGTFEFIAPPGKEILRVVATEKPTADLAALLNVVFDKPDEQLTAAEKKLKAEIRAKVEARLQSISSQQAKTMTYRGLLTKQAMQQFRAKVEQAETDQIVLRELPTVANPSTFTMVASGKQGAQPLLVTIPLQSVSPKP